MILVILFIGIVIFILGALLLPNLVSRLLVGGLGLIILLGAAVLLVGNDNWHWGMHQATTTRTQTITSVSTNRQLDVLVYQPLKQSTTERVYAYRTAGNSDPQHTTASLKTHNRVKHTATTQAQLVTKTTVWRYDSKAWHWLYSATGKHHELIKTQNTFILPKSWEVLSERQAKWLATAAKAQTKASRKAYAAAITKIVKQQQAANANLTAAQLKTVEAKATQAVNQEAAKQAPKIKARLIAQAKEQPVE